MADDPLALASLFEGGGEPWLPLLKPVIERQADAGAFIGPQRSKSIVPVRELTFQALKPNPPERWKVVVFGQNPYPRVESATGIAMFDNTFHEWKYSKFGRVVSIRCIIKAACMWKYRIAKKTPIAKIRALLEERRVVQPPEWFQAMLTQGVLLLNAALTASSDGTMSTEQHTMFWRPVVEAIVQAILQAKEQADESHRGVVFAWWGSHARALRSVVERLQTQHPDVPVQHVNHCNPAAQGDIFCDGNHFADINTTLRSLSMEEIDWLPSVGWNQGQSAHQGTAAQMGEFIAQTMDLHKFYLDRLQSVKDELQESLAAITGIGAMNRVPFTEALQPVITQTPGIGSRVKQCLTVAREFTARDRAGNLDEDEIAVLYLYTTESTFYRQLNAALREPSRTQAPQYFLYLRVLISALAKLEPYTRTLWRGVALDLRPQYPRGQTIVWWGVSSCTARESVAKSFMGSRGRRTLFEITPLRAVSIRHYSAYTEEDEYLLAPGTQLRVMDVKGGRSTLSTIQLEEVPGERLVS